MLFITIQEYSATNPTTLTSSIRPFFQYAYCRPRCLFRGGAAVHTRPWRGAFSRPGHSQSWNTASSSPTFSQAVGRGGLTAAVTTDEPQIRRGDGDEYNDFPRRLVQPHPVHPRGGALAQANTLHPFNNSKFRCSGVQPGVMFFPDKPAGYCEARRAEAAAVLFNLGRARHDDRGPGAAPSEAARELFPRMIRRCCAHAARLPRYGRDRVDLRVPGSGRCRSRWWIAEPTGAGARIAVGFCQGTPMRSEIEDAAPASSTG